MNKVTPRYLLDFVVSLLLLSFFVEAVLPKLPDNCPEEGQFRLASNISFGNAFKVFCRTPIFWGHE